MIISPKFVSTSELSKNTTKVLKKVEEGNRVVIMRNNHPMGYLVPVDDRVALWNTRENAEDTLDQNERFCDVLLSRAYRDLFVNMHGVEPAKAGENIIDRLVGLDGTELMRELPIRDHYRLWLKDGKPELFTMQPYDVHMDSYRALREFCLKYGLEYSTGKRSWYKPAVSILIVISRQRTFRR